MESVLKVMIGGIVICIATFGGCTIHSDYRMAQAIKGGANPIDVGCAFNTANSISIGAVCAVRAARKP
jgi:hypothetical protein